MNGRRSPDGPEDVDAVFAEIVAGLRRDGVGVSADVSGDAATQSNTQASAGASTAPAKDSQPEPAPASEPDPQPQPPASWRGHETEWDWSWGTEDEHYVPPEPPPLPRLRPLTITAIILLVLGVMVLVIPALFGLAGGIATTLGLVGLTTGLGLLLLRARTRRTDDSDDPLDDGPHGNGAQI
jgi:hypothetical protein